MLNTLLKMIDQNKVLKLGKNNLRMRIFILLNLPLAFLAGLKVVSIDRTSAAVSIPYKYLNKNPFRSIYFAALSMAAELSTGILAMAAVHETHQPISMLVLDLKAQFKKKATGKIIFTCTEGNKIFNTVQKCLKSNEGQIITVNSVGLDKDGNEVAVFEFSWTFKRKN